VSGDDASTTAFVTTGALIIIAIRLVVPLSIFRWPLAGGIASMLVDAFDVVLIELIGLGGFNDSYHTTDKLLDTWYLSIEWLVAWRWENPFAKWIAVALFPYRVIGVVLFELTEERIMLFIFPNLFENWWLYCLISARYFQRIEPRTWFSSSVALVALLIPKMAQEYLLHYQEAQPWDWIKRNILRDAL
jgi:hypothetical protein